MMKNKKLSLKRLQIIAVIKSDKKELKKLLTKLKGLENKIEKLGEISKETSLTKKIRYYGLVAVTHEIYMDISNYNYEIEILTKDCNRLGIIIK